MLHARSDYNRIQDPAGVIPADEPVFLIRGKDKVGPAAVREWAKHATAAGASLMIVDSALRQAEAMEEWQAKHGSQVPDMPDGSAG